MPSPAKSKALSPFFATLHCANVMSTSSDPSKRMTRARIDESTSNLNRHARTCGPSTPTLTPAESTIDIGHFRYLVAAWSARHERPYAIIEDVDLRRILLMLDPNINIHSRQTVARDISDMYERSRIVIARHLQSIGHRLHLTLDGWTSPNVFSFLGVTVRYFEKGDIHSFVLDFVKYVGL
jgi:hypothetical protein